MMYSLLSVPALAVVLALSGCESDPVNQVILPENLQISTVVSETGLAEVTAQADLTNFYTATVWNGSDSVQFQEASGNFSWQLTAPGTYAFRVRAHTTATDFIEKLDTLIWFVDTTNSGSFPLSGYSTPISYPGYTLVWNDEFSGTALSSDWVFDIGTGNSGWGNNELQYYTNQNVRVLQGVLEITAKKEPFNTSQYTSTRIKTQGQKSWKYGRIDIRAAMPQGQGIWPALWMLGDAFSSIGWPHCGEIDIMEMIGGQGNNDRTAHGTAHWFNNGHASHTGSKTIPSSTLADKFHVYSIVWNAQSITWLLDDQVYNTLSITDAQFSSFHEPFFFIFNVAVGGNWPGSPNASTNFPQPMYVDYVRVFQ